ncbi:glutamate racemase [Candidatus Sodalis endolongispinus]|uniref:Glutamate racemase n=1 Tax=Candidatus Sodalis endolongispinus TaxID=2812662 RepID=A0ABS5YAC1_9GAMM|nr:glutamate racemase [Candidatus Sodalis endolongispinus]MBT9431956.1 glutamate racemase [Candidatus Sodalis endolongispinus]
MATRLQGGNSISPEPMLSDGSVVKRPTILVFDSGVGGMSIYDEVRQTLPNAHYLYVFDNEAFPYGEKPEQFIVDRGVAIVGAMWQLHKIDLVIVACNTASTISLQALRECFPCPIIGVVPAIKPAARLTRNGIVGLLATRATVQRSYTHDLINQYAGDCQILQLGTAELVDMAEAKLHGEMVPLPVLRKLLRPWLRAAEPPDTVVLGCTHFPLLSQELQAVLPEGTRLVDSGSAIARRAAWLVEHDMDVSSLQGETGPNKAYCLATTPQAVALMPALTRYGFGSLGKLTL